MSLQEDIQSALNRASRENLSNTADYILAEFLMNCLETFERATRERDHYNNLDKQPEGE